MGNHRKLATLAALICLGFYANASDESSFSISPYGFIKFDAAYETGCSSHGNFAFWAVNPGDSDGLFHATANNTRLGLDIKAGKIGSFKVAGKIEIDFYGGGAENKAWNYMRHAYLELSNDKWTFVAGQYWDIISPLNPFTLNYPVMWGAGNVGYRRPQLSATHRVKTGKALLTFQAGIFRTISGDLDSDGIDDGTAEGTPTLQGRIAARFPFAEEGSIQLGISGHSGKSTGTVSYDSHSLHFDLSLVLSKRLTLLGEWFTGKNLLPYLGAIIQGVNPALQREIETSGFFATLVAGLTPKLKLNAGYGQDQPDEETLSPGMRSKNQVLFANLMYSLGKKLSLGFEIYHVATDFLEADSQKTLRLQHSWILNF